MSALWVQPLVIPLSTGRSKAVRIPADGRERKKRKGKRSQEEASRRHRNKTSNQIIKSINALRRPLRGPENPSPQGPGTLASPGAPGTVGGKGVGRKGRGPGPGSCDCPPSSGVF